MKKSNNIDWVVGLIDKDLERAEREGYSVTKNKACKTVSVYYTIGDGQNSISFRISDHWKPTYRESSIQTLNVSYGVTEISVHNFVKDKIKGLRKRSLNAFLSLA